MTLIYVTLFDASDKRIDFSVVVDGKKIDAAFILDADGSLVFLSHPSDLVKSRHFNKEARGSDSP